jgi:hypothetical protein
METLKLRDNLFRRGNEIISYDTIVAHIEDDKLIEHGRYSRTTSKHIGHPAYSIYRLFMQRTKSEDFINMTPVKLKSTFPVLCP